MRGSRTCRRSGRPWPALAESRAVYPPAVRCVTATSAPPLDIDVARNRRTSSARPQPALLAPIAGPEPVQTTSAALDQGADPRVSRNRRQARVANTYAGRRRSTTRSPRRRALRAGIGVEPHPARLVGTSKSDERTRAAEPISSARAASTCTRTGTDPRPGPDPQGRTPRDHPGPVCCRMTSGGLDAGQSLHDV
jgi:hypothetical protein